MRRDALAAGVDDVVRTGKHAGRGAADLDMRPPADRLQMKHGVEGGHLEHADHWHFEDGRHALDRRLGHPALLLLGAPEQSDYCGGLPPLRKPGYLLPCPGLV